MGKTDGGIRMRHIILLVSLLMLTSCTDNHTGLYVIGGSIEQGAQTDMVQIVDFDKGEVRIADWVLPQPMENSGVARDGDYFYIIQGLGYSNFSEQKDEYIFYQGERYLLHDPGKNAPLNVNFKVNIFTTELAHLPSFPGNTYGEGAAVELIGDCLYKVGATGSFNDTYCFNISSGTWNELNEYPFGREFGIHAKTPAGGLLVCGGNSEGQVAQKCFELNVSNHFWVERTPLPTPLMLSAYTQDGDILHIIGGVQDVFKVNETYHYLLTDTYITYNLSDYSIKAKVSFPKRIQSGVAGVYKGKLYVVGGTTNSTSHYGTDSKEVWEYNPGYWTKQRYELIVPVSIPARDNSLVVER